MGAVLETSRRKSVGYERSSGKFLNVGLGDQSYNLLMT